MNKYKFLYGITLFFFSCLLVLQQPMSVLAVDAGPFCYLAIGDSIAKGYSYDDTVLTPYPSLIQEGLAKREGNEKRAVLLNNVGKNGISTARFNTSLLERDDVQEWIWQADLITVTMGANDLIDEFKRASQDILGRSERFRSLGEALEMLKLEVKEHPSLVLKMISAISNWDYATFEEDYCEMMHALTTQSKVSAQVVVTNIYNPTTGLGLPGTLEMVVDSVIRKMNKVIEAHAADYGYQVVDLAGSKICDYVQEDGLHPTQEGLQLIAEAMLKKITWGLPEEEKQVLIKEEKKPRWDMDFSVLAVISTGITGVLLIFLDAGKQRKVKRVK